MDDLLKLLEEMVQAAKRSEFKVPETDKEAFTYDLLRKTWEEDTPHEVTEDSLFRTTLKPDDPLQMFHALSARNLDFLWQHAQQNIAAAIKRHGPEYVVEIIAAAKETCNLANIECVHDPNYPGSAHEDEDKSVILQDKALKAPYLLAGDRQQNLANGDDGFIYCAVQKRDAPARAFSI